MIFNNDNKGAAELRRLTGSYYAGNDFSAIEMDVLQASQQLASIVGQAVFDKAERLYTEGTSDESEKALVTLVQRPVALLACINYFKKNDVSHEDSGRKAKLSTDGSDKIPWEWQLDRDNAVHLEEYYRSVEALIKYLNDSADEDWLSTGFCRLAQSLIISSGRQFDMYYPIDKSERVFIMLSGFVRELQIGTVKPAYGPGWDEMISSDTESDALYAARKALALLSMATALRRLPLQLIPVGVVRGYLADNGIHSSVPATVEDVSHISSWLESDGRDWLDRMKRYRDGQLGDEPHYLPDNNKDNKYFRL